MPYVASIITVIVCLVVASTYARSVTSSDGVPEYSPSRPSRRSRQVDNSSNWNDVIDIWLAFAKRDLKSRRITVVSVDDVYEDFQEDFGFLEVRGHFVANQGWLGDVQTLRRVDKASAVREGNIVQLSAMLGWDDLNIGFDYCKVEVLGLRVDGNVKGRVRSNSVRITLAFENVNGECKTSLVDLKIVDFGDFDLKVYGLGSFNFIAAQTVLYFVDIHRDEVLANTERKLKILVTESLEDYNCDEDASLFMVSL